MTASSAPVVENKALESIGSASIWPDARSARHGVCVGVADGAGMGFSVGLPGCGEGAEVVGRVDGFEVGCELEGFDEGSGGATVGLGYGFGDGIADAVVGKIEGICDGGADGVFDGGSVGALVGEEEGLKEGSDVGQKLGPLVGLSVSTTAVSTLTTDWGVMKSWAASVSSSRRLEPAIQLLSVVCASRSEAQAPESTLSSKNELSASFTVSTVAPSSLENIEDA